MASIVRKKKTPRKTVTKDVVKRRSKKDAKPKMLGRGKKTPPRQPAPDLRTYELEDAILGTNQAADLCGQTGQWLRYHVIEKVVDHKIAVGPNAIALGALLKGIVTYYQNMMKTSQANRRVAVADIRAAKAARHLLETDNVVDIVTQNYTALRAEFEGIPAMVTRDLELRKKIADAIHDAFRRHHGRITRQLEKEDVDNT